MAATGYNPAEAAGGRTPILQTPEQIAREKNDRLLTEASWVLQGRDGFDCTSGKPTASGGRPLEENLRSFSPIPYQRTS